MITVLGKFPKTQDWLGRPGFNVMPFMDDWTPEKGRQWLDEAIARGDEFILVSDELTGEYRNEVEYLLKKLSENTPIKVVFHE